MQPEHLAVALRPRGGWEALDLGFQMARQWWRPIWFAWLTVYLPVAALLLLVFENKWIAVLILFWLKPLFDRAVLHTLSRAVFGEIPSTLQTLRAARDWLRPGLFWALTFARFNVARSFTLPVAQLEKQTGRAARKRRAALDGRMRGHAVWLWLFCIHFEGICVFALAALAGMLIPAGQYVPATEDLAIGISFWDAIKALSMTDALYYVAAVSLIEPFYVAAGFALYLARRAMLEGWDIEIALRRMEDRLQARTRIKSAGVAAMLMLAVCLGGSIPNDAGAVEEKSPSGKTSSLPAESKDDAKDIENYPMTPAREAIEGVFASPEFSQTKDVTRWHYLGKPEPKKEPADLSAWTRWMDWLANVSLMFGGIGESLAWIALGVLVILAVVYLSRYVPALFDRTPAPYRPPKTMFGLEVAPESLPDDIAAAAKALAAQGRIREALSLLYRGALSALIHRHQIALSAADTEGDCLRAARKELPPGGAEFFGNLVQAWQRTAYAGRAPDIPAVDALCTQWPTHFVPPAS
jgi:Domain of unknown function (DUF4129)